MKKETQKAFGTTGAVLLGVGSMVGAGVFVVIGQAGTIVGNLVWISFILGGVIALLSGYSLAKLALRYPSRGGIIEYLVQGFGDNIFTGVISILFYLSQLIAIAAVAKSFGIYFSVLIGMSGDFYAHLFSVGVILLFLLVHLTGSSLIAKFENMIVSIKIGILIIFVVVALFYIDPANLVIPKQMHVNSILFAVGLTFFAYQGFSVITNTIEDMQNPQKTMLRAMIIAILFVIILYILISVVVFGNLSLDAVVKAKDYALAQAAEPVFGNFGFKIIAITALLATASAINATLYAATEISYTMAKRGELPKEYDFHVFHSYEGLVFSTLIVIPMILFFNLSEVTTVAALIILIVQGMTHVGHLKHIKETKARFIFVLMAMFSMFAVAGLMVYHNILESPDVLYYIGFACFGAFLLEVILRFGRKRTLKKHTV
jgi:amino acid transporter